MLHDGGVRIPAPRHRGVAFQRRKVRPLRAAVSREREYQRRPDALRRVVGEHEAVLPAGAHHSRHRHLGIWVWQRSHSLRTAPRRTAVLAVRPPHVRIPGAEELQQARRPAARPRGAHLRHAALDEPARGVRGDAADRGKGAAVGGGAVLPADQHGGDAEAHAGRLLPDGQHPGPVVQHLQPVGRHLGVAVHVLRAPYDSGWAPHRRIAVKVSGGAVRDVAAGGVVHGGDAVEEPQPARRALVVQHRPPQRRHAGQRAHGARPRAPAVGRARQVQALHQAQPRQRLALVAVPSLPACHQAPPWQTGQHGHMGVAQRGVAFP
mmetsp:Transcript_34498/g.88252  ORF Transcript_34498/g.88252 Transcript_34498/m.88252 type:complete len:321 (-) Transcript_34498:342-1304(-)